MQSNGKGNSVNIHTSDEFEAEVQRFMHLIDRWGSRFGHPVDDYGKRALAEAKRRLAGRS